MVWSRSQLVLATITLSAVIAACGNYMTSKQADVRSAQFGEGDGTVSGIVNETFDASFTEASLNAYKETLHPVTTKSGSCILCHAQTDFPIFATLDDYSANHDALLGYGLVNLNTPENSKLYTKIVAGHEGYEEDMADSIVTAIKDWADAIEASGVTIPDQSTFDSLAEENSNRHGSEESMYGAVYDEQTGTYIYPFEVSSPISGLSKAKDLLVGSKLTSEEASKFVLSSEGGSGAVDLEAFKESLKKWQDTPEADQVMEHFIKLNLNIIGSYNFTWRFLVGRLGSEIDNGTERDREQINNLLIENVETYFLRTAMEIYKSGRPFHEVVTTRSQEMTTGLLSLLASIDNIRSFDRSNENRIYKGNLHDFSDLIKTRSLKAADFADWRTIHFSQANDQDSPQPYTNLGYYRELKDGDSTPLYVPQVGFFSSLPFKLQWATNNGNVFRVTINQTLLAALGATFEVADRTKQTVFTNLADSHSDPNTACYSCHKLMDPMIAVFENSMGLEYRGGTRKGVSSDVRAAFAFQGVSQEVTSMDDYAKLIATHPLFATAWTQKACTYFNSQSCDEEDPEFQRIAGVFQDSNYNLKTLVREVLASPLTTRTESFESATKAHQLISIRRSFQLCKSINSRVNSWLDARKIETSHQACRSHDSLLGSIASDAVLRGAVELSQPASITAIQIKAYETFCYQVGAELIDVKGDRPVIFQRGKEKPVIAEIIEHIVSIPRDDERFETYQQSLEKLFSTATKDLDLPERDALRHVFAFACSSPDFMGVGL